jgi:hypothetical protein
MADATNDDDKVKKYRVILNAFLSHRDGVTYRPRMIMDDEVLLSILPEHCVRYFALKVYGCADPTPDMRPVHGRSNSILFWKKAISYFMPQKNEAWNNRAQSGNPTRSVLVNEFVRSIKKKEVRKQGAPSQARRALLAAEYESIIRILRSSNDNVHRYLCPAFHIIQFNMIARVDDTAHIRLESIVSHHDHAYCLLARMNWSKNVNEERDAPWQIMFGAMNSLYCPILALAIHLETWFASPIGSTPANTFLFGIGGDDETKGPKQTSQIIYNTLKELVFNHEEFRAVVVGNIGTHSFRKFPATLARKKGASRDDVDLRGRWRSKARVSDVYIDIDLPHNDAKTASKLSVGGPIR